MHLSPDPQTRRRCDGRRLTGGGPPGPLAALLLAAVACSGDGGPADAGVDGPRVDAPRHDARPAADAPPPDSGADTGPPDAGMQNTTWSKGFGGTLDDSGRAVAVDPAGNVYVAGLFRDVVSFGGSSMTFAGAVDIFLAKFDSAGKHLWSKRFGGVSKDSTSDIGKSLAVDDAGNVYLAGEFTGRVSFGGPSLTSATPGAGDVFIARFDSAGKHIWSKRFGGAGRDFCGGVAVDSSGQLLLTGGFQGQADFGGGPLTSAAAAPNTDIFIVKLDGAGKHIWSKQFGKLDAAAFGVATGPSTGVVITGSFQGTVDFGGKLLVSGGGPDLFVARLDGEGKHLWSEGYGAAGATGSTDVANAVIADAAGNVYLTGRFESHLDFGGATLTCNSYSDIFLVKLAPDGKHLWSKALQGKKTGAGQFIASTGLGVAVDTANNLYVTGGFGGKMSFGGYTLTAAGARDIFLARYDSNGKHVWSRSFGATGSQVAADVGYGVAVDAAGAIYLTGSYGGPVDFGNGPLSSAGFDDIFLVKFSP